MGFGSDDYLKGFHERKGDYRCITKNNSERLILRAYIAGVALECLFRYRKSIYTSEFSERHNLRELYINSKIENALSADEKKLFDKNIPIIIHYWNNSLRYCSQQKYNRELGHRLAQENNRKLGHRLAQGEKENNRELRHRLAQGKKENNQKLISFFNAIEPLINIGEKKWNC